MSVTWMGMDKALRELHRIKTVTPRQLGGALYREAEHIMTRSKAQFVPVKDGILRASGHVEQPEYSGNRISVTLGYGGAASAYALVQHERTDYQHTVGQAKYLEQPVNEAAAGLGQRVAARMRV